MDTGLEHFIRTQHPVEKEVKISQHAIVFANVVVRTVCTQALGIRGGHSSRSAGVRYMPSMVIDHRTTHLFG